MTTPVPSAPVGPLYRSLLEALETVAARDQVRSLLRSSLVQARLDGVPEDPEGFRRFVEGALTIGIERTLGAGAADMVRVHVSHVLAMVAPTIRRRATGTSDEDADELSGERSVETAPTLRSSGVAVPRPRPDVAAALRAPSIERSDPAAPTLFAPRATSFESGTQKKRAAIARVSHPSMATRDTQPDSSVSEVQAPRSGPRSLATDVLVITLDPRLVREVEQRLGARSRVVSVVSLEALMTALARLAGQRIAVVLDTGVPSIDLSTFASAASALPSGTHVVLWGTDERQKRRLEAMFPQARAWVASGAAESAADLLLDE